MPSRASRFSVAVFSCLLAGTSFAFAEETDGLTFNTTGNFNATLAGHIHDPSVLASQKLEVSLAEKIRLGPDWSGVFGFRAWDEPAYALNPDRYPAPLSHDDSRDLRLRDFYVEHKRDDFTLRVGNQQVVWGEAFGYFYSDIVNPKDLRFGGFGDLVDVRMPLPMANLRYTTGDLSLQAIWIPKPFFSFLPLPGPDFAFPYKNYVGIGNVAINRQESLPISAHSQEAGLRASYLIGTFDLSVFYFNYLDRFPYYTIDGASALPQSVVLDEQHSRVSSVGGTGTAAVGDFVFRFEALTTLNRTIPTVYLSNLSSIAADDYVYVLGTDFPSWNDFNLGLQWSQDILAYRSPGAQAQTLLFRNRVQSLLSLRVQRPTFSSQSVEAIYTYETSDGGQRLQSSYLIPVGGQMETSFGIDFLSGPGTSDFGRINQGSRAFVLLKYFLKT